MKERVEFDLNLIFSNSTSDSILIFQNLLIEIMNFDEYLCSTWGLNLQETPLLLKEVQNSPYFGKWYPIDKEIYGSIIDSDDESGDVLFHFLFESRIW